MRDVKIGDFRAYWSTKIDIYQHRNPKRKKERSTISWFSPPLSLVRASLPALSDSNSPADIITGSTPMAWKISSVWKDLPCPFPPQMPAQMYHSQNSFHFKNYVHRDTTIWSHTNVILQGLPPSSYPCQHETRMAYGGWNMYHIDMPKKHTRKCDDRTAFQVERHTYPPDWMHILSHLVIVT